MTASSSFIYILYCTQQLIAPAAWSDFIINSLLKFRFEVIWSVVIRLARDPRTEWLFSGHQVALFVYVEWNDTYHT